jgi:hypothetical protein
MGITLHRSAAEDNSTYVSRRYALDDEPLYRRHRRNINIDVRNGGGEVRRWLLAGLGAAAPAVD